MLVLRNALLIPTMSHNLFPPFLVREAGLFLDETPKHQAMSPTIGNHLIYGSRTGMRIHLQLQGIFSVFTTCPLSLEESENWENYPVVFITPDGNSWNPHSTHFAEEEAAMVDHFGVLVECSVQSRSEIFDNMDVGELYCSPVSWDCFDEVVSHVAYDDPVYGYAFDADEVARLDLDRIQAQLALLSIRIFATGLMEWAHISHASMAMGSVSINDSPCEIFEGLESTLCNDFVSLAAVTAGCSGELVLKISPKYFVFPMMMLQGHCRLCPNWYDIMPICPYQETSQQMIVPFIIARSSLISLRILSLPLPRQRVLVGTFVDKSLGQIKTLLSFIQ
jgi:hypothetical protein